MKKAIMLVLTVALVASVAPLSGAEWWEKKNYTQWSEKDVEKMLNDSPWSQDFKADVSVEPQSRSSSSRVPPLPEPLPEQSEARRLQRRNQGGGANVAVDRGGAPEPPKDIYEGPVASQAVTRTVYHFQIHSALPVRQAMVRRAQLQRDYAQMPAEEKQSFDEEADQFLKKDFSDWVVIFVWWESEVDSPASYWREQTTETLKDSFFLKGSNGRKAELQEFALAQENGRAFQFTFPRQVGGEALAGPGDKSLRLEFIHPGILGRGDRRVVVEFKTKKMVVDGQLVY